MMLKGTYKCLLISLTLHRWPEGWGAGHQHGDERTHGARHVYDRLSILNVDRYGIMQIPKLAVQCILRTIHEPSPTKLLSCLARNATPTCTKTGPNDLIAQRLSSSLIAQACSSLSIVPPSTVPADLATGPSSSHRR